MRPCTLEVNGEAMSDDPRLFSTSAARNKDIIAEAFTRLLLPGASSVLEIGSGTGEHAEAILTAAPNRIWQGSDPDEASQASTTARMTALGQPEALAIDTREDRWWGQAPGPVDVIVAINVIHITPFSAVEALFRGAGALLRPGGHLFLYGPYVRRGVTEDSNREFEVWLKEKDPSFGLRDLDDQLQPLAARCSLELTHVERVPANNHVVIFTQRGHEES